MSINRIFLFINFIIVIISSLDTEAQSRLLQSRYNERTYSISNFVKSNLDTSDSSFFNQLKNDNLDGYIFKLVLNNDSSDIHVIHPSATAVGLTTVFDKIDYFLNNDSSKILTFFFDYDFSSKHLLSILRNHKIYDRIWDKRVTNEWPTTKRLLSHNKQIMCFSYTKHTCSEPYIKYLWDYAVSPCWNNDSPQSAIANYCKGKDSHQLMYLPNIHSASYYVNTKQGTLDHNPELISNTINIWKNTGKKPNFIIFNNYNSEYKGISANLNLQLTVSGTVSYNLKPINKVFWEGDFHSVSYGNYTFPVISGESMTLKPQQPGYKFSPQSAYLENIDKNTIRNFAATPLSLHENIEVFLPFNKNTLNKSIVNHKAKNHGVSIKKDMERGMVSEFDGHSHIALPTASELGISNNNFTVSAWIKLAKASSDEKWDFTILGTEKRHYRSGLHLQVRRNKPYFGFFTNDLEGNTELDTNRWYHVVWRYTKYNKEQAIFINGVKDSASKNHPPFISNDSVFVGKSLRQNNIFEGNIDDLIIWNRPLGENEIWQLYLDVQYKNDISLFQSILWNKHVLLLALILFAFLLVTFSLIIKKKRTSNRKPRTQNKNIPISVPFEEHRPQKNAVFLFGPFQVIDKNGANITELFSPKLKQLFIYLLIESMENIYGISSDIFLNTIWPSFDRKKAINNRGVSIKKLRDLLSLLDGISIKATQDKWILETGQVYCDYYDCKNTIKNNLMNDQTNLNQFISLIQKGSFLQDSTDACFDEIKGKFSNQIIDILTKVLFDIDITQNPEMVIKITDRILQTDDMNEDALKYQIQALIIMRQSNQARYAYKTFADKYSTIYNESYNKSFDELI